MTFYCWCLESRQSRSGSQMRPVTNGEFIKKNCMAGTPNVRFREPCTLMGLRAWHSSAGPGIRPLTMEAPRGAFRTWLWAHTQREARGQGPRSLTLQCTPVHVEVGLTVSYNQTWEPLTPISQVIDKVTVFRLMKLYVHIYEVYI